MRRLVLSLVVQAAVTRATAFESAVSDGECTADAEAASCEAPESDGVGSASCGCGALKRSDFATGEGAKAVAGKLREGQGETKEESGIIYMDGGSFLMGLIPTDAGDPSNHPQDFEGPPHEERVAPFGLGRHEVSNARFEKFVADTGYITEAEAFGWSFGVEAFISAEVNATIESQVANAPWWLPVSEADWRRPNGRDTSIDLIMNHPVTQVSLADAEAFCNWSRPGGRVPTEEEWEFAARGPKKQRRFPWGSSLLTGPSKDKHRMNVWQSELDQKLQRDGQVLNLYGYGDHSLVLVKEYYGGANTALDGWKATAPVDAYGPQNTHGFYNMVGNVWEWTSTKWEVKDAQFPPVEANTMVKKGGSYLCNAATCNRYRSSARMMFTADSAASNVGFRCAYPAPQKET